MALGSWGGLDLGRDSLRADILIDFGPTDRGSCGRSLGCLDVSAIAGLQGRKKWSGGGELVWLGPRWDRARSKA